MTALVLVVVVALNAIVIIGVPCLVEYFDQYKGVHGIHRLAERRMGKKWLRCNRGIFCHDCMMKPKCLEETVEELKREIDMAQEGGQP